MATINLAISVIRILLVSENFYDEDIIEILIQEMDKKSSKREGFRPTDQHRRYWNSVRNYLIFLVTMVQTRHQS